MFLTRAKEGHSEKSIRKDQTMEKTMAILLFCEVNLSVGVCSVLHCSEMFMFFSKSLFKCCTLHALILILLKVKHENCS